MKPLDYIFLSFDVVSCISSRLYISEMQHAAGQQVCCIAVLLYRVPDEKILSNSYQVPDTCHALILRVDRLLGFTPVATEYI